MWPESDEIPKPLKSGLTTGTCATACSIAAAYQLLANTQMIEAEVTLPKGKLVKLPIIDISQLSPESARADVIKDAGDDPDATHGATVFVELTLTTNTGVMFKAAKGVGTVTRKGLLLNVGEPAINPVPRKMICQHLENIASLFKYTGGFNVAVGVENGEEIALKTMNGRLGIIGGLSILGTTGIVRPFSCAAYIASIYQGIDVASVNGSTHLAATTGNRSEEAIKAYYQMDEMSLIEMGDFVGAVISQLNKVSGITKLSICGGFGKISKLAMGKWNLHSQASSIDLTFLAGLAKDAGADESLLDVISVANTSIEALDLCNEAKIDLGSIVCHQALMKLKAKLPKTIAIEVWAINRPGALIGYAGALLK